MKSYIPFAFLTGLLVSTSTYPVDYFIRSGETLNATINLTRGDQELVGFDYLDLATNTVMIVPGGTHSTNATATFTDGGTLIKNLGLIESTQAGASTIVLTGVGSDPVTITNFLLPDNPSAGIIRAQPGDIAVDASLALGPVTISTNGRIEGGILVGTDPAGPTTINIGEPNLNSTPDRTTITGNILGVVAPIVENTLNIYIDFPFTSTIESVRNINLINGTLVGLDTSVLNNFNVMTIFKGARSIFGQVEVFNSIINNGEIQINRTLSGGAAGFIYNNNSFIQNANVVQLGPDPNGDCFVNNGTHTILGGSRIFFGAGGSVYHQTTSGTIQAEVLMAGAPGPTTFSVLDLGSDLVIDGGTIAAFLPSQGKRIENINDGDTFDVITAPTITGDFGKATSNPPLDVLTFTHEILGGTTVRLTAHRVPITTLAENETNKQIANTVLTDPAYAPVLVALNAMTDQVGVNTGLQATQPIVTNNPTYVNAKSQTLFYDAIIRVVKSNDANRLPPTSTSTTAGKAATGAGATTGAGAAGAAGAAAAGAAGAGGAVRPGITPTTPGATNLPGAGAGAAGAAGAGAAGGAAGAGGAPGGAGAGGAPGGGIRQAPAPSRVGPGAAGTSGAGAGTNVNDYEMEASTKPPRKSGYSAGDESAQIAKPTILPVFSFSADNQSLRETACPYRSNTEGLSIVLSVPRTTRFTLGGGISYARTNIVTNNIYSQRLEDTKVDNFQLTVTGTYDFTKFYVDGLVSFGRSRYTPFRCVVIGFFEERPKAYYYAWQNGARLSVGKYIQYTETGITLTPSITLEHSKVIQDAYNETDAPFTGLQIAGQKSASVPLTLAMSMSKWLLDCKNTAYGALEIRGSYIRELHRSKPITSFQFLAGSPIFLAEGLRPIKSSYTGGITYTHIIKDNLMMAASYDFLTKKFYKAYSAALRFSYTFK